MSEIICPNCSNTDKRYFYLKGGKYYCRRCISFIGENVNNNFIVSSGEYKLSYSLTEDQRRASDFILKNIKINKTCALNAVCGAGKTEIIYESLRYCLMNNKRIGIAIPRKDVVIELEVRIKKDFNVGVVGVWGGNTDKLQSDIIIFTTHQAYRYLNYFDVLIIDEVDAFPFHNNEVLQSIIKKCSKCFVYLSATMPGYIENNKEIPKFYVNRRYHNFDLPIPVVKICFSFIYSLKRLLKRYRNKVVFVYFPTIKIQLQISKIIKCDYLINSLSSNRGEILEDIKKLDKGIVFSTTVLERGITVKDVQVIVFNSEHNLFNKDTLIQISGRVGRNKDYPSGNIVFLCKNKSKQMNLAIRTIRKCNE